jgi:glycogen(starch) synthase
MVITRRDSPDASQQTRFEGIPVYRFPFCSAYAKGDIDEVVKARREVARLKRAFAPELVHMNGFGPSVLFHLETSLAHPAPLLLTLHGERYKQVLGTDTLQQRVLCSADWVIGCSAALVANGRALVPGITGRSSVIRNALPSPGVLPAPLPFAAPRFLCLGRLVPEKGFDLALKAFALIVDRFPGLRLVIAGDGPERSALERQAIELRLQNVVDFTGWAGRADVPALMNRAVAVLMPSRREGLPLVALEAAQMGRPVVATRVGGLPEIVLHDQTGLVIEPDDSNGFAEAIGYLLDNPQIAISMGEAARKRIETDFGWKQHVDAYDGFYHRLIGETGGSAVV